MQPRVKDLWQPIFYERWTVAFAEWISCSYIIHHNQVNLTWKYQISSGDWIASYALFCWCSCGGRHWNRAMLP